MEHQTQAAIVRFHRSHVDPRAAKLFAIPNGGYRGGKEKTAKGAPIGAIIAGKLKAEGLEPGAADLVLALPKGLVVWIETKTPKIAHLDIRAGVLSDDQERFFAEMDALGHPCFVVRGVDEYVTLLRQLGVPVGAAPPMPRSAPSAGHTGAG